MVIPTRLGDNSAPGTVLTSRNFDTTLLLNSGDSLRDLFTTDDDMTGDWLYQAHQPSKARVQITIVVEAL